MAQRAKYTWRGRTYTRKSKRPGKRTVSVKPYCRRPGISKVAQWFAKERDMNMPF